MTSPCALSLLILLLPMAVACSHEEPAAGSAGAAPSAELAPDSERAANRAAERTRERPDTTEAAADETQGSSAEARPIDPATTGRIAGVVQYRGEPPERKRLALGNEAACNAHPVPPETETVVVTDGRVRDVFVYVKRGHEGWIVPPPPAEPAVMSQVGCIYTPHALAIRAGQELHVHNADATTHNVNMKAKRNGVSGNYTQGQKQADLTFTFERREHSIPFRCDIHPWMSAWLYVQDHPWFALSGTDGSFVIEGLPAGSYTLEALHEELGELRADVTVTAGGTAEVTFTYPR